MKILTATAIAVLVGVVTVVAVVLSGGAPIATPVLAAPGQGCETLSSLRLPNTTVTSAQSVGTGEFSLPSTGRAGAAAGGGAAGRAFADLPPFCRVAATLTPSSDSDIKIEVWMPSSGWNGKFLGVGNGGFGGAISYPAMAQALRRGYATSSTDTGHSGNGASFAVGHPEKVVDFGYRSIHEMTVGAKAVVDAFYGSAPRLSYFQGCSTGGRQALQEAQRFPADYNGIIAGASPHSQARFLSGVLFAGYTALKDPANTIPRSKYAMVHTAVLDACDKTDGLKDGLIDDPRQCHFDPKMLQCKSADGPDCLTAAQVHTANTLMSPTIDPKTGEAIFLGLGPGVELNWNVLQGGPEPLSDAREQFKGIVFENPNWDWRTFNPQTDPARAEAAYGGAINANDPNLKPFAFHGGKLLVYHGWADTGIPSKASVNYYERVVETIGTEKAASTIRLFMVPGMGHCGGGEGPNTFDMLTPLENWIEKGEAPARIVASHSTDGKVDRTRPLCAYPQVARYTGTGSTDDAANFACRNGVKE